MFAVQSVLYSYGATDTYPDGIEGSLTDDALRSVIPEVSLPITRNTLVGVDNLLASSGQRPRLLPLSLPRDVVDTINREMGVFDPAWPLLQIPPSQVLPAGRVASSASRSGVVSAGPRWRR